MLKRTYKRTLDNIGIQKYDFDYIKQKDIYRCLCCAPGHKKVLKKLDKSLLFNSYNEWKQFIVEKYKDYDQLELIEFSRYLNQRLRNLEPVKEVWKLYAAASITIVLEKVIEFFNRILVVVQDNSTSIYAIIAVCIVALGFILLIIVFIWNFISPSWKDNFDKFLITDYREIIDEMIELKAEKMKNDWRNQ